MPASASDAARVVARTRAIKRLARLCIQPAIVETLYVGEDVTRQLPAVSFLLTERLAQRRGQLFQHSSLANPGDLPITEHGLTSNQDRFDTGHLATVHHCIDHRDSRI